MRWKGRGKESARETERERDTKKDGGGRVCRHGALMPTPVPSALTYFQSGFYLDQTQALAKRFCLIFLYRLFMTLVGCWNDFNYCPVGKYTIWKIHTVHIHSFPLNPHSELFHCENKLRVWTEMDTTKLVNRWLLITAAIQYIEQWTPLRERCYILLSHD